MKIRLTLFQDELEFRLSFTIYVIINQLSLYGESSFIFLFGQESITPSY